MKSMREEYGKCLVELGTENKDIVVLEGDLKESTQSSQFGNKYPNRYFDMGLSEQNMIGISAGFALCGKIPVVHSFACFLSMRACEQVRTSVAYPNLNVKIVASHGGISSGSAGPTHHSIEDIAIMRSIPNMTVLVPGDVSETKQVVKAALSYKGPVYIRLTACDVNDVYTKKNNFSIGKSTELRKGNDATIITTGVMMYYGVSASDILKKDYELNVRVLQTASIKPIDILSIKKAAKETKNIITIEEHNIIGGLGGAVSEIVAEDGNAKVRRMGINDHFCDVGSFDYLMKKEKITIINIIDNIRSLIDE